MTPSTLRRASLLGAVALLVALVTTVSAARAASAAGGRVRAVSELSDHIQITAQAFDGSSTQQDPADEHADSVDEFDEVVSLTDDSPAVEVRTGTGTATETVKVVETAAHDVVEAHVKGAADGTFDDADIEDGDSPFGRGDAEFRIAFEVTDSAATFSLTGTASASSTGLGRLRGGSPCSRVLIGVPDGTFAEVGTPSACGLPASDQLRITGTLQPGQHEFTVSAFAQAASARIAHHGHAQVQFSLDLAVAQCDVTGTPEGERLDGTDEDDVICGLGGHDSLIGGGGNDTIIGGGAVDDILGGSGNDLIFGEGGADQIGGGADNDVIFGGDGCDDVGGGAGNDEIHGGDEPSATRICDQLDGGADQDHLFGERGPSRLEGGTGNDVVEGGPGNDLIFDAGGPNALLSGAGGVDGICGSPDPDFIVGGDARDFLTGNEGVDTIHGGPGDDVIAGGGGGFRRPGGEALCVPDPNAVDEHDFLFGEANDDDMTGDDGGDEMNGGPGVDTLEGDFGIDKINGGGQRDDIDGGPNDDNINACDGGPDDIEGGTGANDRAKVNRTVDQVTGVEHVTKC